MDKKVFRRLPVRPDFGDHNVKDIRKIGQRALAIHEDAQSCLEILALNSEMYAQLAFDVFNMIVDHVIDSAKDPVFDSLDKVFDLIKNEFTELLCRYDDVEQNGHVDAYVKVELTKISDTYSLGLCNENKCANHPKIIREQAVFVLENDSDVPDYDSILEELDAVARQREEIKAQKQFKDTEDQIKNKVAESVANTLKKGDDDNNSAFQFVKSDKKFSDVAGLKEVKEDLVQIVDFINRPDVYKSFGAKLPKGTILYGPPGTGKTLLAKAVAGEANASFIALNSTDFTASRWGEVPKMIKDLFRTAREHAPCIIFIDEIDMLGMDRGSDKANSLAHRESLNAFLSAMDGFDQYEGVTVMAATNRLEDLDPAMIRPGRFDNLFAVPLPHDIHEVEEVVRIYMKNKCFDEEVKSIDVARKFLRMSPATIESVINEACLIAIKKNRGVIRMCDINEAHLKKIMKGHVRENQETPQEDIKMTAVHEAGHALVAVASGVPVQSVTVMGTTTGAGGLTMMEPYSKHYFRKSDYENQIRISYGGRAAEELAFGVDMITTGASADIRQATNLIKGASANYGFNLCDTKTHAPMLYKTIAQGNVEKAANKYYQETIEILKKNVCALKDIAKELIENGTVAGDKVKEIYDHYCEVGNEITIGY